MSIPVNSNVQVQSGAILTSASGGTVDANSVMGKLYSVAPSAAGQAPVYNGSEWVPSAVVAGSGTTGYIPVWTGTSALGDSHIDDGVTLSGILTLNEPVLAMNGGLVVTQTLTGSDLEYVSDGYGQGALSSINSMDLGISEIQAMALNTSPPTLIECFLVASTDGTPGGSFAGVAGWDVVNNVEFPIWVGVGNQIFVQCNGNPNYPTMTGYVGINNANPACQLDVVGAIGISGNVVIPSTATGYHGSGSGDVAVQLSDGTGASGYVAVFDANGGLTNSGSGSAAMSGLTVGVSGTTSGVIELEGGTSGTATISAPAVAGTVTNPIVLSNAIGLGVYTAGTYSTTAGALGAGYSGAANLSMGDGTNSRRIPMTLYHGFSFAATGNVTTLTSLFATPTGSTGSLTLVANQQTVGSIIHVEATGTIKVSTATQTLNFSLQLNGGVCSALAVASVTTTPTFWDYEGWIYCSAVGASGTATMKSLSRVNLYSANGTTTYNIAPAVTSLSSTVATTGTQLIDLKMDFGTSESANTCQMLMATVVLE